MANPGLLLMKVIRFGFNYTASFLYPPSISELHDKTMASLELHPIYNYSIQSIQDQGNQDQSIQEYRYPLRKRQLTVKAAALARE